MRFKSCTSKIICHFTFFFLFLYSSHSLFCNWFCLFYSTKNVEWCCFCPILLLKSRLLLILFFVLFVLYIIFIVNNTKRLTLYLIKCFKMKLHYCKELGTLCVFFFYFELLVLLINIVLLFSCTIFVFVCCIQNFFLFIRCTRCDWL